MNELLSVRGIKKTFRKNDLEIEVLKGIDLDIYEGDLITIMGPSGAGKSTFLHILGMLDSASSGDIYFRGRNIKELNEDTIAKLRNEKVGFVFQFYHLLQDFNVAENIALPLLIRGMQKKRVTEEVEKVLSLLGLLEKKMRLPSELSGGERQRVAIARALINKPEIILADEPTGNLDRKTGYEILDYLLLLNRDYSYTLVIVTHDPYVGSLGKKRLKMVDGELFEE